jgi:multiple sugar transport system substrate-binding protein
LTRRQITGSCGSLVVGGVVACAVPGQTVAPSMDERDVTLTYLTDWTGGARGEWVKQAIPRFTQEFPRITVRVEYITSGGTDTAVLAGSAAGTLQDIFFNPNDIFQQLARQGDMKEIAPVLRSLRVNQNDIVSLPSTHTYKGKQYGLPMQFGVQTMMINKTLFRQNGAPLPDRTTTYPQWLEMLRRIARPADGIYGYLTTGGTGGWGQWMPFVWSYGGDRWSADLKKCLFDHPSSIEGLQFYVDLMYRYQVGTPLNAQGNPVPSGVAFQNGNVACASASSPGAGMDQQVGGKFEWDVMYAPLGPKTNKRAITTNSNANIVSANASKRGVFEQAVQFVAWAAASKTAQDLIVEIGPTMPVYKPVLNGPKFLAGPPASQKLVVDQMSDWRDPQTFIGWTEFRDTIVPALQPAYANQKSVPDAAREAARVGQLVLDKIPQ